MPYLFDIKSYLKLLNENNYLNTSEKSFLPGNKKNLMELLSYRASVESQISYGQKNLYYSLIAKYLAKSIEPNKFRFEFLDMQREDMKASKIILNNLEELAKFLIDLEAIELSSLITEIDEVCNFAIEFGDEDTDGISETDFRDSIERTFLQMEKYFDTKS